MTTEGRAYYVTDEDKGVLSAAHTLLGKLDPSSVGTRISHGSGCFST